jgi:hypothetical protein
VPEKALFKWSETHDAQITREKEQVVTTRFLLVVSFALCLAFPGTDVRGQDGRFFAGNFFETLYAAIDMDHLRVQNPDFRHKVLIRTLAAVVIPPKVPPDQCYVLIGSRDSTELIRANLSQEDFNLLQEFAQSKVFLALEEVLIAPNNPGKTRVLQQEIAALPGNQQEAAKRMIGARMADIKLPDKNPMVAYVDLYKDHVEKRTMQALSKEPDKFQDHKPYSFGTPPVSQGSLQSIPPDHVKIITVGGKQYQQAWVDGSLVIVPQSKSTGAPVKNGAAPDKPPFDPHVIKNVKSEGGKKLVQTHHH